MRETGFYVDELGRKCCISWNDDGTMNYVPLSVIFKELDELDRLQQYGATHEETGVSKRTRSQTRKRKDVKK